MSLTIYLSRGLITGLPDWPEPCDPPVLDYCFDPVFRWEVSDSVFIWLT